MTAFSARVDSAAEVSASREDVWKVLTDPAALTRLTPLLKKIDDRGELWVWHMTKVGALGMEIVPVFTEKMTFVDCESIQFEHAPPAGANERIGVQGRYDLSQGRSARGSRLAISLIVTAELPLPRVSSPAVTRVMRHTMVMMGDRFAKNLLGELAAS